MKKSDKLYILIPKNLSEGIIKSQIFGKKTGYFDSRFKDIEYISFDKRQNCLMLKKKVTTVTFFKLFFLDSNATFYTRSIWEFFPLLFLKLIKQYKIIYDYRGAVPEESFLKNKNLPKYYFLKFIDRLPAYFSEEVHCVSEYFKNYLFQNYKKREYIVIPCLVNEMNFPIKEEKNVIKFIYVGGLSVWQKFEEILKLFSLIENEISSTLTIVTPDTLNAKMLVENQNIRNYRIVSGDAEVVKNELKDSDFGFLLRDNIIVNNVASPVKFLEYISNGVVPILTEGIGDYSNLVSNNLIGIVWDMYSDPKSILPKVNIQKLNFYRSNLYSLSNSLSNLSWGKYNYKDYKLLIK